VALRIITPVAFSHHGDHRANAEIVSFVSGHRFSDAAVHNKLSAFRRWAPMSIPVRNPDSSRMVASQRTFFVTSSTWGKQALLQSDRAARLLIDVLYHYHKEGKYLLHEFVIMPDHFHLLITVGAEITVEKAVQFIKGGFAFRAGRELGFRAPVCQKGFSEVRVTSAEALVGIRAYIQSNNVKRSLAQAPAEYQYSSAHPGFERDVLPQRLKPPLDHCVRHR
jgi:putative transposase